MILLPYHIAPSTIPGAGKGLFLDAPARRGQILIAPDRIDGAWPIEELKQRPDYEHVSHSLVRWFEQHCTLSPDWPDECYVNHSFEPSGLWHLGFIFARRDLPAGTEVCVDYRHLLPDGEEEVFRDALTGEPIIGHAWAHSLALGAREIAGWSVAD